MLDHNEKPFIHLKAQAFVCPFLFEMIFTDLALGVINPFIIKTVLKSSDTQIRCWNKTSDILKSYAVKSLRFPIFRKLLAGGGARAWPAGAGLQQFVTFPGNLNISVLRGASPGQFPPMWRLPSPRFSAKTDILLVLRPGAGRSQMAGAGLSEQTAVWPGAGREMSYLL